LRLGAAEGLSGISASTMDSEMADSEEPYSVIAFILNLNLLPMDWPVNYETFMPRI
jgi:hypothetical protein